MSMEEYLALVQGVEMMQTRDLPESGNQATPNPEKKRAKSSKYGRTYKKEFRKLAPRFKMKNGKWKKDGFKAAVKAAHRATRKNLG